MKHERMKILLIEDSQADAGMIREMLAKSFREGLSVQHVQRLEEGVAQLQERKFDLVIVDLGLPDSQGLDTALAVRKASSRVPIVALTVLSDITTALEALQQDIQDYVFKDDFTASLLARAVRYAIERKRNMLELAESRERFRALVTASCQVVYRMNADWSDMLQLYSQEFLTNRGVASRDWLQEYIPEEEKPRVLAAIREAVRARSPFDLEHRIRRADGAVGWVHSRAVPLMDDGEIVEWFGAGTDISQRKRAEAEIQRLNADLAARAADLEAANKQLESFNYVLAHDLRQPLNTIGMASQAVMALCGSTLTDECREMLTKSNETVRHMSEMTGALLEFTRLTRVELHRERVDLSAMARNVAEELEMADPGRGVTFRIAGGVVADVDGRLLRIVLKNLLENAWKYTSGREEAVIEFDVMIKDGDRVFFVRDNGIGFDMNDAEALFTPFQRVCDATNISGFGIGLATVERIVRYHGGKVWAEGTPGHGTVIFFTLGKGS